MKISISDAKELVNIKLLKIGFSQEDADLVLENLLDAELAGKKSHGLVRLKIIEDSILDGSTTFDAVETISETPTSIYIDVHNSSGFVAIYKSLDKAFEKIKDQKMVCVVLKDVGSHSGYIGSYARKAAERGFIFLGFNSSYPQVVPHGSKKPIWGTNPLTVGVPTDNVPVVLDMASSKITWGDVLSAKVEGKEIGENLVLDKKGNPTTDPAEGLHGGYLPIAGHKGSGLAFIVQTMSFILSGTTNEENRGSSYILIDPTLFGSLADFKKRMRVAIDQLKNSPKAAGVEEVYYPGENAYKIRLKNLENGYLEISDGLYRQLTDS